MLQQNKDRQRTVTTIREARIKRIADDYYRRLIDYGVESASFWLRDQLERPEDTSLFRTMRQDIARKYGLTE